MQNTNLENYINSIIIKTFGSSVKINLPDAMQKLLSGQTELQSKEGDSYGNKEYQFNPHFWEGQCFTPSISRFVLDKMDQSRQSVGLKPLWPNGKSFAICLTHDVDYIKKASILEGWRQYIHVIKKTPKNTIDHFTYVLLKNALYQAKLKTSHRSNPYSVIDKILQIEANLGVNSTFFFFTNPGLRFHHRDCWYTLDDKISFEDQRITVGVLLKILNDRGWEVGLHGSYYTFNNPDELKREKEKLEKYTGIDIVSSRFHLLHFDIYKTPNTLAAAGLRFDSTFGFNRMVGFRNGWAWPFFLYDYKCGRELNVLQIPLNIQDSSLLRSGNLNLDKDTAFLICKKLIDAVRDVGGIITLSWHSNVFDEVEYPQWSTLYTHLIEYGLLQNAWIAPVSTIGEWWLKRIENLL